MRDLEVQSDLIELMIIDIIMSPNSKLIWIFYTRDYFCLKLIARFASAYIST